MRISLVFTVGAVLLASCRDFGAATVPTGPTATSSVVFQPPRSVDQTHGYWARLSPAEKRAAVRTIERISAEAGDVYVRGSIVVIEGVLPNGAEAVVIQEPMSPERPLLILSRQNLSDRAFVAGITAFSQESARASPPGVRRMLHVATAAEGRVARDAGSHDSSVPPLSARLAELATSITPVELPGFGRGTLFRFD